MQLVSVSESVSFVFPMDGAHRIAPVGMQGYAVVAFDDVRLVVAQVGVDPDPVPVLGVEP